MLVDLKRQEAKDLGRQSHPPLHLSDGVVWCIDIQKREVRLAALLDFIGQGLKAPVLALGDLAATFFDEAGVFLGECLDLSVRDVLARQEDMLIEWHAFSLSFGCPSAPAQSPLRTPRKAQSGHP